MTDEKRLEEIQRDCRGFTGVILREKKDKNLIERMALLFREHTGFLLTYIESLKAGRDLWQELCDKRTKEIESLKEEWDEAIKERKDAESLADFQLGDSEAQLDSAEKVIAWIEERAMCPGTGNEPCGLNQDGDPETWCVKCHIKDFHHRQAYPESHD